MGAWETDLIGNDTVQDFFIEVENISKIKNFADMVNKNSLDDSIIPLIKEKREKLLDNAKNEYSWESSMAILSYIGILKMLNIELTEDELQEFEKALKEEYRESEVWSEPELRESYIKALEIAVKENTTYDFSMKIMQ